MQFGRSSTVLVIHECLCDRIPLHGPAQVTGNVTQGTNGAGTIAMPAIPAAVVPINCPLEKFFGLILFIGSDVDFSKKIATLF